MRSAFALLVALVVVPRGRAGDDAAFAAQRTRQLRILAKIDAPQPVRLNAIEWLGNIRDPKDTDVFAAVDKAIKDPDAQVRAKAVGRAGSWR